MIRGFLRPSGRLARNYQNLRAPESTSSSRAAKPLPYTKHQPSATRPSPAPAPSTAPSGPTVRPWRRRPYIWWCLRILEFGIVLHLFTRYVASIRSCVGPSMLPTLNYSGDWVVISKLHARMQWIKVGDLISFHHPVRQGITSVKRVIGMPGDFVLRDTPGKGEGIMVRVPPGHCWVIGDNLDGSRDSRMFGALPLALVKGKVVCRLLPSFTTFEGALTDPVILEDDCD